MGARTVVPDTNLLILYVLGSVDPTSIGRHKRLRIFELDDLTLLTSKLASYDRVVLVPNVLTEVSNLMGRSNDRNSQTALVALRSLIAQSSETYVPSSAVSDTLYFGSLGLTDSVLIRLSGQGHSILTMDAPLCAAIWSSGGDAINFNTLRADRLFD